MKRSYQNDARDDTEAVSLPDDVWGYITKLSYMVRYKDEMQNLIEKIRLNEHGFVTPKEDIKVPIFTRLCQSDTISIYHDISRVYWNKDGVLYAIMVDEYEFYQFEPQTRYNIYYSAPVIRFDQALLTEADSFNESRHIVLPIENRYPVDEVPVGYFTLNMDLIPREILHR